MKKSAQSKKKYNFPLIIEQDEDGYYIIECPVLSGCYTQGKTMEEALKNIEEVIKICLAEKETRELVSDYHSQNFIFSTITV